MKRIKTQARHALLFTKKLGKLAKRIKLWSGLDNLRKQMFVSGCVVIDWGRVHRRDIMRNMQNHTCISFVKMLVSTLIFYFMYMKTM